MRRSCANARIDMRTTPQCKYFLELAAFIGGYGSLSDFMVKASENLAKEVFDTVDDSRELSHRDRDLLLSFLENPPEPNDTLKEAYKKIHVMYQLDDNGQGFYDVDPSMIKNPGENANTQGHAT